MPYSYYNMNLELSNVLLSVSGIIMSGLLAIIFYGLRSFAESVKELKTVVYEMNSLITVVQERVSNIKLDKDKTDISIEHRILSLTTDVYRIDEEISDIKRDMAVLKTLEEIHHK